MCACRCATFALDQQSWQSRWKKRASHYEVLIACMLAIIVTVFVLASEANYIFWFNRVIHTHSSFSCSVDRTFLRNRCCSAFRRRIQGGGGSVRFVNRIRRHSDGFGRQRSDRHLSGLSRQSCCRLRTIKDTFSVQIPLLRRGRSLGLAESRHD